MNTPHTPTRTTLLRATAPQLLLLLLLWLLGACSSSAPQQVSRLFPSFIEATRTPFQPQGPTPTKTVTPTPTPEPFTGIYAWMDPSLPQALKQQIHLPKDTRLVEDAKAANLEIGALRGGGGNEGGMQANWVYALAAPFPTLVDEVNFEEVQRAWRGEGGQVFTTPLLLTADTRAAFTALWGPPAGDRVQVVEKKKLLDKAWDERPTWALIPFEDLEPRWKVIHVDGKSPFDKDLNLKEYPLTIWFGAAGQPEALQKINQMTESGTRLLPAGNIDPKKMTVLVMTGVTALARATGYKMDTLGATYPGRDIVDWLTSADLTHISNEVSFNPDCPKANFMDTSTMFCSRPEYIDLLKYVGTDIVELSGNHNNDWGRAADSYSLEQYRKNGWSYFAGGANLAEAKEPLKITNNGNKLAFIGCNPVGPGGAWATNSEPGAAPCGDYGWMLDSIRQLREEGYLPIVTFQYFEIYVPQPSETQVRNFRAAVDAGAVIVSGSQAHFPQTMEFYKDAFIHYGLGNLFFDQMDVPVVGTRREFVDRYVFYNGKYISTELQTALLEDYARPRPMSTEERHSFLEEYFRDSGW